MKAVVPKQDLIMLIAKIQSIVANKPAIPILANVLIEAIDDQLIFTVTDLTTSMRCYTEAKVVEEGAVALPARRFFYLIRELTSPQVKISCPSNELAEIISGSSVFKINGMHKNEFPTLPDTSSATNIVLQSNELKEMLSRTSFSAAREDSRYVLTGILLQIKNKQATFMGTDGKRLAKAYSDIDIDPSFQGSYILPLKAVEEMIKLLDETKETASLNLLHDKVFLEYGNNTLITKLMTSQYPDVERVIPKKNDKTIILHREELIALLRQISLFTSDSSHPVRFLFENGKLELNATSSDIGEGNVSMPVDYFDKRLEVAFNPNYFQDILRHSKDETVNFCLQDSYNPGAITDSTSALFVIMPMRLTKHQAEDIQNSDDSKKTVLT